MKKIKNASHQLSGDFELASGICDARSGMGLSIPRSEEIEKTRRDGRKDAR